MCRSAAANAEPILIEKSTSPDGRKEIIIVPSDEDTGIAAGTAKIRDVKTGKILWSFDWSGFWRSSDSKGVRCALEPRQPVFCHQLGADTGDLSPLLCMPKLDTAGARSNSRICQNQP